MRCHTINPQHARPILGYVVMMLSEAKIYYAYARECLELAETADTVETRQKLIELSRDWMEAALAEEMRRRDGVASSLLEQ
jgi:hypothetical protein